MLEKNYPFVVALFIAVVAYFLPYDLSGKNFAQILSSVITIGAILIGFLATMMSILITITGKRVIKRITALGASGRFTGYFFITLVLGFILVVFSSVLNAFTDLCGRRSHYVFVAWIFVVAFFLLASFRIVHLMARILKNVMEESKEITEDHVVTPDATKAWKQVEQAEENQV